MTDTIEWKEFKSNAEITEEVGIDTPILIWLNKKYFDSCVHVSSSRRRIVQGTFFWDMKDMGYTILKWAKCPDAWLEGEPE